VTPELLYEVAANAAALTVSGAHLEGVGSADGALPHGTGLEARWMGEVGHAVTRQGLDRAGVNQLILRLLERYESIFKQKGGNPGKPFTEAYHLQTIQPSAEWLDIYQTVKNEVRDMGLPV
jgi:methylamine--corrinoid protein Co-methyltransferase